MQIWVVFGAANQLMASLALLLVTLWLMSRGKNYKWTFWPFLFMFVTTIGALLYKAYESFFINLPKTADPVKYKLGCPHPRLVQPQPFHCGGLLS